MISEIVDKTTAWLTTWPEMFSHPFRVLLMISGITCIGIVICFMSTLLKLNDKHDK